MWCLLFTVAELMKVRVGLAYTGGLGAIHVDPADSTSDVVLAGGHVHL